MRHTLKFNLVLHNQILALGIDLLGEFGGNCVVSSLVFENKTLVALNTLQYLWFLNVPCADELPFIFG